MFPTLSALAGIPLPDDRPFDGKDMSEILLNEGGKSKHEFLFFYSTCSGEKYWSISSVRHGKYKVRKRTIVILDYYNIRPSNEIVQMNRIYSIIGTLVHSSRTWTL